MRWSKGISQIIHLIESGQESYHIRGRIDVSQVRVAINKAGYKYVQAVVPFDDTNQLLGLSECIVL